MKWIVAAAFLLLVVSALPVASAAPAPLQGSVRSCSNTYTCSYALNSSAGTGTATTTYNSISFRLPGETNTTRGSYSIHGGSVNGSVHWTVGTILATDVNTGKVVVGTTDTNISITVSCSRGCTTTYTLINGTITLQPTRADPTATSVSCTPSSFGAGHATVCTASVTDLSNSSAVPTGTVAFGAGLPGHWLNKLHTCTLVAGSCSVKFRAGDNSVGALRMTADYRGVTAFYLSAGTATVYVH